MQLNFKKQYSLVCWVYSIIFPQTDGFSSIWQLFIICEFHYWLLDRKSFINQLEFKFFFNFNQNDIDEFASQWWIFTTMMNFQQHDEFSSLWWLSLQCIDEFYDHNEFSAQRCLLIKIMNFHYEAETPQINEFVS